MHDRHPQDLLIRQSVEIRKVVVERVSALHAQKRSVPSASSSLAILRHIAHQLKMGVHRCKQAAQAIEVAKEAIPPAARGHKGVRGDHPGSTGESRFQRTRKIQVTVERAPEKSLTVPPGQVIAENSRPNERVQMKVDHLRRGVELNGLTRNT